MQLYEMIPDNAEHDINENGTSLFDRWTLRHYEKKIIPNIIEDVEKKRKELHSLPLRLLADKIQNAVCKQNPRIYPALYLLAISKCKPEYIANLYTTIPANCQTAEVTRLALKRSTSPDEIHIAMSGIFKTEENSKYALKTCFSARAASLYAALPEKLKHRKMTDLALEQTISHCVPELYCAIPNELRSHDLTEAALQKCHTNHIPDLFTAIPEKLKTEDMILMAFKNKCRESDILKIYTAISPEQRSRRVTELAIERMGSACVKLFHEIPEDLRTKELTELLFKKSAGHFISKLYASISSSLKTKEMTKLALMSTGNSDLCLVYSEMPEKLRTEELTQVAFSKCSSQNIAEFFNTIPVELRTEKRCRNAIQNCRNCDLRHVYAAIPAKLKPGELTELAWKRVGLPLDAEHYLRDLYAAIPVELRTVSMTKAALKAYGKEDSSYLNMVDYYLDMPADALEEQMTKLYKKFTRGATIPSYALKKSL